MPNIDTSRQCAEQYQSAIELNSSFVHAYDVDDYYFGMGQTGLAVLKYIPEGSSNPVVLDIGAGYGLFLREAVSQKPEITPLGITAVDDRHTSDERITWVFGDFQRPETWQPDDVLEPGSVDLAVASLTFQHFADPLKGLKNAIDLLKPDGHLLIDEFAFPVITRESEETIEAFSNNLKAGTNTRPYNWIQNGIRYKDGRFTTVCYSGLHLTGQTEFNFDALQPTKHEALGRVVYTAK